MIAIPHYGLHLKAGEDPILVVLKYLVNKGLKEGNRELIISMAGSIPHIEQRYIAYQTVAMAMIESSQYEDLTSIGDENPIIVVSRYLGALSLSNLPLIVSMIESIPQLEERYIAYRAVAIAMIESPQYEDLISIRGEDPVITMLRYFAYQPLAELSHTYITLVIDVIPQPEQKYLAHQVVITAFAMKGLDVGSKYFIQDIIRNTSQMEQKYALYQVMARAMIASPKYEDLVEVEGEDPIITVLRYFANQAFDYSDSLFMKDIIGVVPEGEGRIAAYRNIAITLARRGVIPIAKNN